MNFAELIDEVQARGFDYLSDTRVGRFVNWAYHEVNGHALWPYLQNDVTGTAPLAVSDLGTVVMVTDEDDDSRVLCPSTYGWLKNEFGDLSTAGTAEFWYPANPSGTPLIATYPVTTSTIGVSYYAVADDLTGSVTPLVPARFHDVIVDLAVVRAYRDSDNHVAAEALQAHVDRRFQQMREALLTEQVQGPELMQVHYESLDW